MSENVVFADEKKGYNKEQVNRYIEELTKRYETALSEKDRALAQLKGELEKCRKSLGDMESEYQSMKEDKERIASVLIDAQSRAEQLIAAAKQEAEEEKERLIREADDKRNLVVERNKMLREMRIDICKLFDDMKQTMHASYEGILQTIEEDLQKFTEETQQVSDQYPKDAGEEA